MGGKTSSPGQGVDPAVQQGLENNETALTNIATQQEANANQLYNLTEPGLAKAEDYFSSIASGDPAAIARQTAPAAQQIAQASQGAKKNILANSPNGGEKNLALAQVDANQGAQVGGMEAQAYLNAPNALAGLAGQTINQSLGFSQAGSSSISQGSSALSSLGNIDTQEQQVQAESKGSVLGALGGLAGDATQLGTQGMQDSSNSGGKGGGGGSKGGDMGDAGQIADIAGMAMMF